ncbi:MAG: tetratricopeptide repeat protein, partial [Holophagales bacterium]|nr:tetratricopeptide repeat protein [Holophagales bacterium]
RRFSGPLALLGAGLLIFDRHVLVYGRVLEPEALMLSSMVVFLLVADRAMATVERGGSAAPGSGKPPPASWVVMLVAGMLAAASVAVRPTFLPLFLFLPLVLLPSPRRESHTERTGDGEIEDGTPTASRRRAWRSWASATALFLLPLAAVLLWLGARAERASGEAGTPAMNPGTVFFEGNQPLSMGTSAIYPPSVRSLLGHSFHLPDAPHQLYRRVARANTGEELSIAEANAFWAARARVFLAENPLHAADRFLLKLRYAFHGHRWHDLPAGATFDRHLPLPSTPFALLAALGLIGMALEARRVRRWSHVYGYLLLQLAAMVVFYVSARQQTGLVPGLVFFALVAVERIVGGPRRWWIAGLALALALTGSIPDDAMRDDAHRRAGEEELARQLAPFREKLDGQPIAHLEDQVVELLAPAPWWRAGLGPAFLPAVPVSLAERLASRQLQRSASAPDAEAVSVALDLADLWLELGRYGDVIELVASLAQGGRHIYRNSLQPSTPHFYLGRALALSGEPVRAIAVFEEGLEIFPGDPFLLAELYASGAGDEYAERLARYLGGIDARWLVGRALLAHDRHTEAATAFASVVRSLPELRAARLGLAASLGRAGHYDEGMDHLRRANQISLEPVLYRRDILHLLRGWLESGPRSPPQRLEAASALFQFGYPLDALRVVEEASPSPELAPRFVTLKRRLVQVLSEPVTTPRPLEAGPGSAAAGGAEPGSRQP